MRMQSRIVWAATPPVIRCVARVAWKLRVDGRQYLPEPPYVLASNHASFLDPLLVGAICGRPVRYIGLSDLQGHYRVVDFFLDAYQVIPVTRGVVPIGAVRTALRHLGAGGAVALFPEGTRHWRFDPRRAKPGAAWLAARTGAPLVPVAIRGTDRVLGVDNRLHRGRIEVVVGPSMFPAGTDRPSVDELTGRWASWVADALK